MLSSGLRLRSLVPLGLAALLAVSAGATTVRGATHQVQIVDFAFTPATLTISAGDTVTWTNGDQVVHTATSTSGAFDSGDLAPGASFSLTFTTPGTYDYLCTPHPTMTGKIVVVAAAEPAAPTASASAAPAGGGIPDVAMAPTRPERLPLTLGGMALVAVAVTLVAVSRRAGRADRVR